MLQKNTILYLLLSFISIMQMSFAQTTAIPDPNFELALISQAYDSGPLDGQVLTSNINTIITIDIAVLHFYALNHQTVWFTAGKVY